MSESKVELTHEQADDIIVALMAAEAFLETLCGYTPAPWGDFFGERVISLYRDTYGSLDADPDDENSDFAPHYYELDNRACEEARKGLGRTLHGHLGVEGYVIAAR